MSAKTNGLRVFIVDNYDSYTYNLYQRIGELTGVAAKIARNDQVTVEEIAAYAPTRIILSPGPGSPEDPAYFGVCKRVILELGPRIPVLGVCLGHQGIASVFGGKVVRAEQVMHGKTSMVAHDGTGVMRGLVDPCVVMRYHSLVVDPATLPSCLRVNARTGDVIMGLVHRDYPIHGVQFHPESIGTPDGTKMIENFLIGDDAK